MTGLHFRLWLEDDDYDKRFRKRASTADSIRAQKGRYLSWFPEGRGRVLLPLGTHPKPAVATYLTGEDYKSPEDQEIMSGLAELGYEITDWRGGYVKRGKGVERIGGYQRPDHKRAAANLDRNRYTGRLPLPQIEEPAAPRWIINQPREWAVLSDNPEGTPPIAPNDHDQQRIKKYVSAGMLAREDLLGMRKNMSTGMSFQDALTVALAIAKRREEFETRRRPLNKTDQEKSAINKQNSIAF